MSEQSRGLQDCRCEPPQTPKLTVMIVAPACELSSRVFTHKRTDSRVRPLSTVWCACIRKRQRHRQFEHQDVRRTVFDIPTSMVCASEGELQLRSVLAQGGSSHASPAARATQHVPPNFVLRFVFEFQGHDFAHHRCARDSNVTRSPNVKGRNARKP